MSLTRQWKGLDKTRHEVKDDLGPHQALPWMLVAEDDEEMRDLIAQRLRRDGFRVIEVGDGRALHNTMEHYCDLGCPPAMVISDIRMPGLSGLEVLREIRARGLTLPVIMITAFADEDTLIAADYLGATAVLDKPFDMVELSGAVQYLSRYPFCAERRGGA